MVAIPAHLVDEIAAEAVEMTLFETFVAEQAEAGRSLADLYPPTGPAAPGRHAARRAARAG